MQNKPLVIWRFIDGKPGHESQTLGLVNAMQAILLAQEKNVVVHDIRITPNRSILLDFVFKRFRPAAGLPSPDFMIGAGHRTHWPMLCARHARGGKVIALMTPSLPLAWFDWVVAPAHDECVGDNVIVTRGVLNAMQAGEKHIGKSLIMLGGISEHFSWDDALVLAQLKQLHANQSNIELTDSRRTPPAMRPHLTELFGSRYFPWEQCGTGWLAKTLAHTEVVWVTEDSVSMIYEALSAGCRVGLISLSPGTKGSSRVVRGVEGLIRQGHVTRLAPHEVNRPPQSAIGSEAMNVAKKCLNADR